MRGSDPYGEQAIRSTNSPYRTANMRAVVEIGKVGGKPTPGDP